MDISKFTKKSQEALSEAQNKAISFGHTEVDGEHLLLALAEQPEGLIPRILARGVETYPVNFDQPLCHSFLRVSLCQLDTGGSKGRHDRPDKSCPENSPELDLFRGHRGLLSGNGTVCPENGT
jgi:hypothetical protein